MERSENKKNEHICKNLVLNSFLVLLWTYFAQCLSVFIIEFGR